MAGEARDAPRFEGEDHGGDLCDAENRQGRREEKCGDLLPDFSLTWASGSKVRRPTRKSQVDMTKGKQARGSGR